MSVLKEKRAVSKAEYVNTANQIYVETVGFLTRLSARYSRLIAEGTAQLAGEVMDHTEKANKIYPSDEQRKAQRKAHLLEALASLSALDVRLTHAYLVMYQNPQGCFTAPSGKTVPPKEAMDMRGAVPSIRATTTISALSTPTAAPTITTPTIPGRWPPDFA